MIAGLRSPCAARSRTGSDLNFKSRRHGGFFYALLLCKVRPMTDLTTLPEIPAYHGVTPQSFRDEIYPLGKPAVLKGYVANWPAVKAARRSVTAVCDYLSAADTGQNIPVMYGPENIDGQFFYAEDLKGLNFTKKPAGLSQTLADLQANPASAIYIQSATTPEILNNFERENSLDIVHDSVVPRIWIGNRLTVQTHFDLSDNIACVVAGRRRFTLFPPSQTKNMYIGPFENTLAGPPISMVKPDDYDPEKYPNFAQALEHGLSSELEPGDALYIPYFWWHHVQSLAPFNILVNYWWNDMNPDLGSPFDALLHAFITFSGMPDRQRKTWQEAFDHLVFKENGPVADHLPEEVRGVLGEHSREHRRHMRQNLVRALAHQAGMMPRNR